MGNSSRMGTLRGDLGKTAARVTERPFRAPLAPVAIGFKGACMGRTRPLTGLPLGSGTLNW
jgi:hypothetical protein